MNGGDWATGASAAIALLAMIGSGVGWLLARREKNAAADQAERATTAEEEAARHAGRAADAAERSAAAAQAQESREAEAVDALEGDPWMLAPIPGDGDCYLINRTSTPKYGITVSGLKIHNSPVQFEMIGPGKRVELSILRIFHSDDEVRVTWHRRPDRTDEAATSTETLPSKL